MVTRSRVLSWPVRRSTYINNQWGFGCHVLHTPCVMFQMVTGSRILSWPVRNSLSVLVALFPGPACSSFAVRNSRRGPGLVHCVMCAAAYVTAISLRINDVIGWASAAFHVERGSQRSQWRFVRNLANCYKLRAQALCANFVLQATNAQGLGTRLQFYCVCLFVCTPGCFVTSVYYTGASSKTTNRRGPGMRLIFRQNSECRASPLKIQPY